MNGTHTLGSAEEILPCPFSITFQQLIKLVGVMRGLLQAIMPVPGPRVGTVRCGGRGPRGSGHEGCLVIGCCCSRQMLI